MKVKFEEGYKRYYTVEEYEQAKVVIDCEKANDAFTAKDWAEVAFNELCRYHKWTAIKIIDAYAETAKNHRHINWEWFGEGSGFMDVRINAIGQVYVHDENLTCRAYVEFSGYVSEINNSGFDEMFNGSMVPYQLFTME